MATATADDIRAQIVALRQQLEKAEAVERDALREFDEAEARQRLRREMEQVQKALMIKNENIDFIRWRRRRVDHDEDGAHMREGPVSSPARRSNHVEQGKVFQTASMDCNAAVVTGEIEWSIKGFSWLKETLQQVSEFEACSPPLEVGGHNFWLTYHPTKGNAGCHKQRGSLAILHDQEPGYSGVVFRYRIWIKSTERGFVQWGDSGNICVDADAENMLFGPDVCNNTDIPAGVFGLNHAELVNSEWVIDDTLTAKLRVEVRPNRYYMESDESVAIVVPHSKLGDELLQLLDEAWDSGAGSDVTVVVQGESIPTHSFILSARSEVFQRQLSGGMQESRSREIAIEDCDPVIFKAFLRYMYSDSFLSLEACLAQQVKELSSSDGTTTVCGMRMPMLQQLLALSHKYQLPRLRLWCERELCDCISIEDVCAVLRQAHLYESKKLEEKCLDFIKAHMNEVVKTEAFGSLSQQWPAVTLKVALHVARVPETIANTALEKQQNARKRKREE